MPTLHTFKQTLQRVMPTPQTVKQPSQDSLPIQLLVELTPQTPMLQPPIRKL
jgi:hypothetical protein